MKLQINQEPKPEPEPLDHGLIEINIKEINIKIENKNIIKLIKDIILS